MPAKIAELLAKRSRFPYTRLAEGVYRYFCAEHLVFPLFPALCDVGLKLADMDRAGVDVAILSLNVPGPEMVGGVEADELARIANDCLAEIIAAHPGRFWGYATLGFGSIEASLKELDRCIDELGFCGLQLMSNINGKPLDSPEFRPIFARMAELRRPIFIHPTVPLNRNFLMDVIPAPALAFVFDTTLAAVRLGLAGIISQYAGCPIIIPHAGGTLPFLMSRISAVMANETQEEAPTDPTLALKQLYMDTVVYGPDPLKWCLSTMGAERVLFGTDHPWNAWGRTVEILDRLDCPAAEREKMMHGNAERLFHPR